MLTCLLAIMVNEKLINDNREIKQFDKFEFIEQCKCKVIDIKGDSYMMDWHVIYRELTSKHNYIKPNPPATEKQISDVEKSLGCKLPNDLKELLLDMNGDNWLIFSTEQITETNLSARKLDCFMPLDCLLFFGGNGCGDYYGYPITSQDGVRNDNVFMWDHEYDNRIWKANNLEDAIKKYYNDEI